MTALAVAVVWIAVVVVAVALFGRAPAVAEETHTVMLWSEAAQNIVPTKVTHTQFLALQRRANPEPNWRHTGTHLGMRTSHEPSAPTYDPMTYLLSPVNPASPLSPLNPISPIWRHNH